MSSFDDQQPIRLTVGKRSPRGLAPPDAASRAAMTRMAQYRTRVPKGIFFYDTHAQMTADRERWRVEAIVERTRSLVRVRP